MAPKVLITRKIFDEALAIVRQQFEVEENPSDASFSQEELVKNFRGRWE